MLLAQTTTTTTPNVTGKPLESQWILLAGAALLVVILLGGLWLRARQSHQR